LISNVLPEDEERVYLAIFLYFLKKNLINNDFRSQFINVGTRASTTPLHSLKNRICDSDNSEGGAGRLPLPAIGRLLKRHEDTRSRGWIELRTIRGRFQLTHAEI